MKTMRRQHGYTMISTLITVAIILMLAVALFKGSGMFGSQRASARPDGKGTTVIGAVQWDAKDEVCRSNLGQVRASIQVYQSSSDDQNPPQLADTKLGNDFYSCPVGHEPYKYDPSTGQVHCVHPGHEKF